jgi:hypothetical protein
MAFPLIALGALSMTVGVCNLLSNEMAAVRAIDFVREKNGRIFNNIKCPSMSVFFAKLRGGLSVQVDEISWRSGR